MKKYYYSSKQRQAIKDRTRLRLIVARVGPMKPQYRALKLNFVNSATSLIGMGRRWQ
ncbi:hypothetical protein [Bradyrhizobium sp. 141]|uniref:hypothetical protein n=1 Tax=Bradyrhizobium sp. 141 TaxID=2782617 RepID=UPI001FF7BFBC|nr:hypothetical protein [Bradyrhizobium sp. 141]MCK1716830.1 hypothetical protein [Bradyrhizobium sp. 141]